MSDLVFQSATRLARAIRAKQVSSREIVDACLERITAVNPELNAVVQLRADEARSEADGADATLARGEIRGPLHGVPMTIKDSFDTAGVITTYGTAGRASYVPEQDATVVSRLREAGAILIGKTNTPELTLSVETDNEVYGRTNNPYDLARTSGGSSGGAAAIVAAGGSPFDIGSDMAGSVRMPAHCCGIAGIKPTTGRVPRTGHMLPPGGVLGPLIQVGPMARYVEDLALVLPLLPGVDWRDPAVVPMPMGAPDDVELDGLCIAVYTDNGIFSPTDAIADTVLQAAKLSPRQERQLRRQDLMGSSRPRTYSGACSTPMMGRRSNGSANGAEQVPRHPLPQRTTQPSPPPR